MITIFGKRFSEYVAFSKPILGLIVVVGLVRLVLSLAGVPNSAVKWISINVAGWIGVLYYSIRVYTSGFGGFKQLLPIFFLQMVAAQVVIVPAIILAIFTGSDNIYSAPEYSFGTDGKTWLHVAAHLFIGTTVGSLVSWLVGCVILFAAKKLLTKGDDTQAAARA